MASKNKTRYPILSPGDILLTDSLLSTWYEMPTLKQSDVHCVSRLNKATRRADFRRGKRLGKGDHVVRWYKPTTVRAVDWETYKTLPDYIEIRETRVRVKQPGFRTKEIILSQHNSILKQQFRKSWRACIGGWSTSGLHLDSKVAGANTGYASTHHCGTTR